MQSAEIGELAKALAATQAEMTAPKKAHVGKIKGTTKDGRTYEYEYRYADLADVIECRKVGAKYGLSITQGMEMRDGYLALATMLMHSSGQWKAWECPIPAGLKPQELGSYLTYMRRYSESGAWGIAAEDDDDGAAAQDATPKQEATKPAAKVKPATNGETITREQIEQIHSAAKKAGMKSAQELAPVLSRILVGVEKASDIPPKDFRVVLDALDGMGRRAEVPA